MARVQSAEPKGRDAAFPAKERPILVGLPDQQVTREHLGRLLRRVLDLFSQDFAQRLHESGYHDIRPGHGSVFAHLDAQGTRATDLAMRAGMTRQAMGEMITELVGRGYLQQRRDPTDGRAKLVTLTGPGERLVRDAAIATDQVNECWGERLGADRMRELRSTLEELVAPIGQPGAERDSCGEATPARVRRGLRSK